MIKDVQGVEARVGDKVAFAGGGRGASEFYVGHIISIGDKTVRIEYEIPVFKFVGFNKPYIQDGTRTDQKTRIEGKFVILENNNDRD